MNLLTLSLARLLSRRNRSSEPNPERIKQTHIPASSFGLLPDQVRRQDLAEEFLAETNQSACQRSSAGMTAFIP